jgi:protein phosphatase 2C family protein 2/3
MDNPLIGPYRVFPGRLSVCRTYGDLEAKEPQLGGNPNVVISQPDILFEKDGCKKLDYALTCSDGIFDKLSTQQVHDLIWTVFSKYIGDKQKTVHQVIGIAVDEVLHASARYNTLDNISVVMIAFEPLITLFDNYRNPQKMTSNPS